MENYNKHETVSFLSGENEKSIDDFRMLRRQAVFEGLKNCGPEVLSKLQILQPSIGCLARCSFCSQGAGSFVRIIDKSSLEDILSGMKRAKDYFRIDALGCDRVHKPGIIFPYLDNDIMSYPYLDSYIFHMGKDLNTKTRLSSIGYSRHNTELQNVHEHIARDLADFIAAIRFSWTPYNYAWRLSGHDDRVGRREYISDFANSINTYLPVLEKLGAGKDSFCITMRTPPCIINTTPEVSLFKEIVKVDGDSIKFTADLSSDSVTTIEYGERLYDGRVNAIYNKDGLVLLLSLVDEDEKMFNVAVLPRTDGRLTGGIIDMRNPINTVREQLVKRCLYDRGADIIDVTRTLFNNIAEQADNAGQTVFVVHTMNTILPILEGLLESLSLTSLGVDSFLDDRLVRSPGLILNQGRAHSLFYRGVASESDVPVVPDEAAQYDHDHGSAVKKGRTWVMSFVGSDDSSLRSRQLGQKSGLGGLAIHNTSGVMIREWDPAFFDNHDKYGNNLRSYFIPVKIDSSLKNIKNSFSEYLIPGVAQHSI